MFSVFLAAALSICVAEMGDKTQLLVMGLASKYRVRDIAVGVISAAVLLNAMGVVLGSAISALVPLEYVSLAAGLFFLIFALLTLKPEECSDDEVKIRKGRMPAPLSIGAAFFLAELGDKTQLTAIAFSANNPGSELAVFLGATAGLVLGDTLGAVCGLLLQKSLPECLIRYIACGIFTFFGFATVYPALGRIMGTETAAVAVSVLGAVYALSLLLIVFKARKGAK